MKRIKELLKAVREVIFSTTKAKIITSVVTGLVIVGGVAGGSYYWYSQNNPSVAGQGKVDGSLVNNKDANLTSDDKKYDDKVIKLNSIVESIKELDPEFKLEEKINKDNIEELTKKYSSKRAELVAKQGEENKEEELAKKEETTPGISGSNTSSSSSSSSESPSSSSSSGSSSSVSSPSSENSNPSTPTPAPAPTPQPAPAPQRPASGNKPDVASEVISYMSSTNGPNSILYTPEQYNTIMGLVDQWFAGGISVDSINSTMRSKFGEQTDFPIQVTGSGTITVQGLDALSISSAILNSFGFANNAFSRCTVYYDSVIDTSTVKYIGGSI